MQKQKMKVGHISGNTSSLIFDIVNTILLLMVCVITLYPFLNTVAISFHDSTDAVYGGIYLWPRVFSLRSYETILLQSSTIPHSALISALRAVIGTALSIPLSMMLAEMSVRESVTGRHTQPVRRIISEILPLLFLTGTMLFLSALSASILPKRESLILVIFCIIAIVFVLRRWFVRIHSRLQIALYETLDHDEENKTENNENRR